MSSKNRIAKQHAYLHTLQLDQNVTDPKIVRKQFRKLAARHHPDQAHPSLRQLATERMQVFEQAKSWLVDNLSTSFTAAEEKAFREAREHRRRQREKRRRAAARERKQAAERRDKQQRRRAKRQQKQGRALATPTVSRKRTTLHMKWSSKLKKVQFTVQLSVNNTWTDVYSGKKKSCIVTGLKPGTKHEFRLGYTQSQSNVTTFEAYFVGSTLGV